MPQPVSYNPGTPISGSIQENNISYVVDGQNRNYRGGFGGLSWMSEVPAENNVIFIGNSTSLGRGPANIPLFYPAYNTSQANIVYAANTLPGSPRNFTTSASAYNWAVTNNFFINNSDNPIPRIDADGLAFYVDANQPTSYPQINNTWYDLSGRGINGTLTNGPTWNSNGWFVFDGTDDYVDTFNTFQFSRSDQFSVCGLINVQDHSFRAEAAAGIIGKGHYYSNSWDIWLYNNESVFFETSGDNSPSNVQYLASDPLTVGRWYFFAATYNNTAKNLWINETQYSNTYTGTGGFTNGNNVLIARRSGDAYRSLIGSGSAFSIYSRALSQSEIKQNYFQSNIVTDGLVLMADASNLVSYPKSGTVAYNLTGSLTGSLLNGVGFSQENGGNWTFDGVDDRISFQSPFGDIDWGTTAFTVMGWIKVDSPNDNDWCLLSSATNSNLIFGTLPYPAGNSLYVYGLRNSLGSPNNQVFNFFASNLWPNGYYRDTWLHVTLTYNGNGLSLGNFAIYSNGVSRTLNNGGSAGYSNANVIQLGRSTYGTGPTEYPNLIVYNRALTPTEVAQNYEATKYKFQGQQIVTNGLVAYVDATNKDSYPGTGTTWYDLSGNGNNFTFSSTPNMAGGLFDSEASVFAYRNAIAVDSSINGYTLEACFKLNSSTGTSWQNITQNGAGDPTRHMMWYNGGSNTLQALFHTPGFYNNISDTLSLNTWYYVQLSYNPSGGGSNGRRAWINGVEKTVNNTAAGNATPSGYFTISVDSDLASNKSDASYAFVRYYNRALSAAEIAQNYNAQKIRFGL